MNKDEVLSFCYALQIKLWTELIHALTFLKYLAYMHNVSLRTFVILTVQMDQLVK